MESTHISVRVGVVAVVSTATAIAAVGVVVTILSDWEHVLAILRALPAELQTVSNISDQCNCVSSSCTYGLVGLATLSFSEVVQAHPLVTAAALQLSDLASCAHAACYERLLDSIEGAASGHGATDLLLQVLLALGGVRGRRLHLVAPIAADPAMCQWRLGRINEGASSLLRHGDVAVAHISLVLYRNVV